MQQAAEPIDLDRVLIGKCGGQPVGGGLWVVLQDLMQQLGRDQIRLRGGNLAIDPPAKRFDFVDDTIRRWQADVGSRLRQMRQRALAKPGAERRQTMKPRCRPGFGPSGFLGGRVETHAFTPDQRPDYFCPGKCEGRRAVKHGVYSRSGGEQWQAVQGWITVKPFMDRRIVQSGRMRVEMFRQAR